MAFYTLKINILNAESGPWAVGIYGNNNGTPPFLSVITAILHVTQKSALEADWDLNETRSTCIGISAPGIQGKPPLELLESSRYTAIVFQGGGDGRGCLYKNIICRCRGPRGELGKLVFPGRKIFSKNGIRKTREREGTPTYLRGSWEYYRPGRCRKEVAGFPLPSF